MVISGTPNGLKSAAFDDGIDAGYVPEAFVFVIAVWTYPISVATACFGRRRVPLLVFLPITNLLGIAATRQFAGK
jgi:hypothetical protein